MKTVKINVKTNYGFIEVEFIIVKELDNYSFVLFAQDRICVGQQKINGSWILSESIDCLNLTPIEGVFHGQVTEVVENNDYMVLHPLDQRLNINCEKKKFEYARVYKLKASSLTDVFNKCQNHDKEYEYVGLRSTSVGDIIYSYVDDKYYMIEGSAFVEVGSETYNYTDWEYSDPADIFNYEVY